MRSHQTHTWMGRIESNISRHALVGLACWFLLIPYQHCSEFPERECCDPIYPLIPEVDSLPPVQPSSTVASFSSSLSAAGANNAGVLTGRSGKFEVALSVNFEVVICHLQKSAEMQLKVLLVKLSWFQAKWENCENKLHNSKQSKPISEIEKTRQSTFRSTFFDTRRQLPSTFYPRNEITNSYTQMQ